MSQPSGKNCANIRLLLNYAAFVSRGFTVHRTIDRKAKKSGLELSKSVTIISIGVISQKKIAMTMYFMQNATLPWGTICNSRLLSFSHCSLFISHFSLHHVYRLSGEKGPDVFSGLAYEPLPGFFRRPGMV